MEIVNEKHLRQSDINNIIKDIRDGCLYRLEVEDIDNKDDIASYVVCPVCESPVKIRYIPGKALHYVHPNGNAHSNESFEHYFTKYFIAEHISSIRNDMNIHLEKTFLSGRRSDIGVEKHVGQHSVWNNIEVEYKNTDVYDFLQKMKLLHNDKVITQWILHYDKFHSREKNTLPKIAEYIMRFQRTLLTTRFHDDGTLLIGTVVREDSGKFAKEYIGANNFIIEESPLEDCDYSPYIGIITPHMKQLYGWGKNFDIQSEESLFEQDESFNDFSALFYPPFIYPHGYQYGIKTIPAYWMHLIYRRFMFHQVGKSFTLDEIVKFLQHRDIRMSKWSRKTIEVFLDHIVNVSLMCSSRVRSHDGETVYTVTSDKPAEFFLYSL